MYTARQNAFNKPEAFVCILSETAEMGGPAKSGAYRLQRRRGLNVCHDFGV